MDARSCDGGLFMAVIMVASRHDCLEEYPVYRLNTVIACTAGLGDVSEEDQGTGRRTVDVPGNNVPS